MKMLLILCCAFHLSGDPGDPPATNGNAKNEAQPLVNRGTVLFFDRAKGIGIITPKAGGKVAVYARDTHHEIDAKDEVSYVLVNDKKRGPRASEVEVVKN